MAACTYPAAAAAAAAAAADNDVAFVMEAYSVINFYGTQRAVAGSSQLSRDRFDIWLLVCTIGKQVTSKQMI